MTNPATPDQIQGRIDIHRQNIKHATAEIRQLENMIGARKMKIPEAMRHDACVGSYSFTPNENMEYRSGDKVTIVLNSITSNLLNRNEIVNIVKEDFISHEPAPEPVVRWCNVEAGGSIETRGSENTADLFANGDRIAKLKIIITGRDVKVEVIPVEVK